MIFSMHVYTYQDPPSGFFYYNLTPKQEGTPYQPPELNIFRNKYIHIPSLDISQFKSKNTYIIEPNV